MDYYAYKRIPNSLRKYRRAAGLSQSDVARRLGFKDGSWVSKWESGEALPCLVNALRLATILNTNVEELFGDLT